MDSIKLRLMLSKSKSKSIYQKLMIIDSLVTVGAPKERGMFRALGKFRVKKHFHC